ncbi:condensation domain-containing protein [Nonomuraea dietziae]|uniref:condensation domain-containing protein n=1 Tax=Nonomuraea dietziae TaxID=65515 RepID=UPI0033F4DEDB
MISADRRQELLGRLAALPPERRAAMRRSLGSSRPEGRVWPLSFGQERLWFLSRFDPTDTSYHVPWTVRLRGPADGGALEAALGRIVERHEVLRTRFVMEGDRPGQVVLAPRPFALERLDPRPDPDAAVAAYTGRPFDLRHDPPIRAALLRLGHDDHLLSIVVHHVAVDGWSLDVLMRELAACYEAARRGGEPELAELPLQYKDYAVWSRERADGEGSGHLGHWRERLAGAPVLDLPTDHPRPARWTGRGGRCPLALPDARTARLEAFLKGERCTLFMGLLAVFHAVLARAAGQDDVCVGVPVAGRDRTEFAPLIGYFSNTLVLRGDLSGDPSLRELLRRTRVATLTALQHAEAPFERVLAAAGTPRDLSRPPLCQAMFNLSHHLPKADLLRATMADLSVAVWPPPPGGRTKSEISADLYRGPEGLGGWLEFNSDLFSTRRAEGLAADFAALAGRLADEPDLRLSELKGRS